MNYEVKFGADKNKNFYRKFFSVRYRKYLLQKDTVEDTDVEEQ